MRWGNATKSNWHLGKTRRSFMDEDDIAAVVRL